VTFKFKCVSLCVKKIHDLTLNVWSNNIQNDMYLLFLIDDKELITFEISYMFMNF